MTTLDGPPRGRAGEQRILSGPADPSISDRLGGAEARQAGRRVRWSSRTRDPRPASDGTRAAWPVVPTRRRALIAVGCALVVFVSAAAFASLYSSASRTEAVLIVTRIVPQGSTFTAADLSQTPAAVGNGIAPVPVSAAPSLKGKVAAVTIPAGSLLTAGDIAASTPIPAGQAVVGLALKAGQLPASGVTPGSSVMLVETGSPGTPLSVSVSGAGSGSGSGSGGGAVEKPSAAVLVSNAVISQVTTPDQSDASTGTTVVSVLVPLRFAPVVATAAAAGQVSLVLLPADGSASASGTSSGGGA